MISNFKETKYYFENMFATNWSQTPIHFVGQEFDASGIDAWVNPRFVPSRGDTVGINGNKTKQYAELDIVCWAKNDVEAFDLADQIVAFINATIEGFDINGYEINDHGWNDSNMVYVVLTFVFNYYTGDCLLYCPKSVGGAYGTAYHLDQPWLKQCTIFKG
jgi:hypothetical protein